MAGEPLLRGVSFKLERRERLTIAGRNGAGKTTLLRMLSGETSIDGGELVLSKGVRIALHDQRPPRERDISLREYVLSGCREPLELEEELGRLETAMAAGDEAALNALQRRLRALRGRRRLRLARARALRRPRPRVRRRGPRPRAEDVLRRPAHARLARPGARRPARPAAARRADEPPRHRVARVARGDAARPRRGGHPRRPRPLVPRDRRHGGARARGRARAVLQRHLARLAPGAGGPRDGARQGDREAAGRDRRAWSGSSSASATRRRRRARRSRASRSSTRSSASRATRATAARSRSRSSRPSARAG